MIYYAAHNKTKYRLIASYLLAGQQITEPSDNTAKPDQMYKSRNRSRTKRISWGSSAVTYQLGLLKMIRRSFST